MFLFQTTPTNTSSSTKGEYVGHIEPPIEDMQQIPKRWRITNSPQYHHRKDDGMSRLNQTLLKPPHQMLGKDVEMKLVELLKEYKSQFSHNETSFGTIPLTNMIIDTRVSEPVSQRTIIQ